MAGLILSSAELGACVAMLCVSLSCPFFFFPPSLCPLSFSSCPWRSCPCSQHLDQSASSVHSNRRPKWELICMVCCSRERKNVFKLKVGGFRLDIGKRCFIERVVRQQGAQRS